MMSKTEGFLILDDQNAAPIGDAAKKAATMRPQNEVRRKLANVSNLPQNQRLLILEKSQSIDMTTKDYLDRLQKENMSLVKMLAQRNKIIEQSGVELDRLRVTLLKMQEQNQQLALSNTQMLAELNSGRDRLKLLQHELGCKSGLLKARKLELEGAQTKPSKNDDAEGIKSRDADKSLKEEDIDAEKPHNTKRNLETNGLGPSEQKLLYKPEKKRPFRRQSARFKAAEAEPPEDSFETNNTVIAAAQFPKERVQTENKRPVVRRQSARFIAAEVKPAEDLTKINDDADREQVSIVNSAPRCGSQELARLSLSRPSRAAKKVQSYKEIPLNIKMRRSE